MATKVTFKSSNINKPAPLWFKKIENALLIILIPSAVGIIQSWGFTDELNTTRLILIINVGLNAIVRATGLLLGSDGDTTIETPTKEDKEDKQKPE